ncbi:MAG TPA: potassium channel family protein [Thermoanaerobaculia bacterium]|nr:potassium channel family protein [Thermoanaerobaculia bacterium]
MLTFCMLLLVPPLLSAGILSSTILDVLFSLVVLSAAAAASTDPRAAYAAASLAIVTLAIRWLHLGLTEPALGIVDAALGAGVLLIFAALVLRQVFRSGPITLHRVRGAVAAFLLLGISWADAYELVWRISPDAFKLGDAKDPRLELTYYSFVTLTTVGYGDITPLIPAARSLAIAEALIGQLFPAVLIARLVSMEIADRLSARDHRVN